MDPNNQRRTWTLGLCLSTALSLKMRSWLGVLDKITPDTRGRLLSYSLSETRRSTSKLPWWKSWIERGIERSWALLLMSSRTCLSTPKLSRVVKVDWITLRCQNGGLHSFLLFLLWVVSPLGKSTTIRNSSYTPRSLSAPSTKSTSRQPCRVLTHYSRGFNTEMVPRLNVYIAASKSTGPLCLSWVVKD